MDVSVGWLVHWERVLDEPLGIGECVVSLQWLKMEKKASLS